MSDNSSRGGAETQRHTEEEKSSDAVSTPASQFVVQAIRRIQRLLRGQTFYLWDPLAAVIAVQDSLAVKEQVRLRVCLEPGPELGRVVEDPRGGSVNVCTTVDRVAFEQEYLQALAHPIGMTNYWSHGAG